MRNSWVNYYVITVSWTVNDFHRSEWKTAPAHTVAGIREIYTNSFSPQRYVIKGKLRQAGTIMRKDADCWERLKESVADVLSGCSAFPCAD